MPSPTVIKYDYTDVPTIAKFAASDAFVRGLMGPFGCVPGDTEFMTPQGWKRIDEYQEGDLVAQWHPDGTEEFVAPTNYIEKQALDFIRFVYYGGNATMDVSSDHRVPFYDEDGTFRVESAFDLAGMLQSARVAGRPIKIAIPMPMGVTGRRHRWMRQDTLVSAIPALDRKQYCFTVPSGFFVARCNGTEFVTGNSGKSSGCVAEIMRRAMMQSRGPDGIRHSRWVVIRNTSGQLSDTTVRTFHMWVPPQHFGRYYESDLTYNIKAVQGCDIEVLFRALDRPDHIRNLLSLEVTGAWVNEAREIPWGIIEALQGRVGRYPPKTMGGVAWSGIFMDTNPPDVDSKWYKFFEEDKHSPGFAAIFKQPSGLSPNAENLTNLPHKDYYRRLAEGKSPEWVKVYIDGEYGFVIDGKPVYPGYSDKVHCKEVQPVKGVTIYRGWDFGLSPACCFSQILPDGRWLIFDEMTSDSPIGADRFSDDVLLFCGQHYPGADFVDIGDPAGESRAQTDEKTCFQILQAKGINIEGGEQSVAIRIESVRKPLRTFVDKGEAQFVLHPRCKMLRKGFLGAYKFRRMQTSSDRYTSAPDKNEYSHVHDSCQYVATRLFGSGMTNKTPMMDDYGGPAYHGSDQGRSEWTGY